MFHGFAVPADLVIRLILHIAIIVVCGYPSRSARKIIFRIIFYDGYVDGILSERIIYDLGGRVFGNNETAGDVDIVAAYNAGALNVTRLTET